MIFCSNLRPAVWLSFHSFFLSWFSFIARNPWMTLVSLLLLFLLKCTTSQGSNSQHWTVSFIFFPHCLALGFSIEFIYKIFFVFGFCYNSKDIKGSRQYQKRKKKEKTEKTRARTFRFIYFYFHFSKAQIFMLYET